MRFWPLLGLILLAGCDPRASVKKVEPRAPVARSEFDNGPRSLMADADHYLLSRIVPTLQPGDWVDIWSMREALQVLSEGAGGDTESQLIRALSWDDRRLSASRKAHFAASDLNKKIGWNSSGSAWMIWPMTVKPNFAEDMERDYGFILRRLGSAGIGSENAVQKWRFDRTGIQEVPKLEANTPFILKSATRAELNMVVEDRGEWVGSTRSQTSEQGSIFALSKTGTILWILQPKTGINPVAMMKEPRFDSPKNIGSLRIPALAMDPIREQFEKFKTLELTALTQGTIDLRGISVELWGEYPLKSVEQALVMKPTGEKTSGPETRISKPFYWMIQSSETGLILAIGRQ